MKLIVLTGANFYEKEMAKILKQANVIAFSRSDISGHREIDSDMSGNWFGGNSEYVDSVMFFAFTPEETTQEVMDKVNAFNAAIDSNSLIRAFVLCVDSHNLNP